MCQEVRTTFSCGHTIAIILPCPTNLASEGQASCCSSLSESRSSSPASSSGTAKPTDGNPSPDVDSQEDEDEDEDEAEDANQAHNPQYKHPASETVEGPCFACLTATDPELQRREALRKQRAANRATPARYYQQAIRFEQCGHSTVPIPTDIEIEDDDGVDGVDLSSLTVDGDNGNNDGSGAGAGGSGGLNERGRGDSKDDSKKYTFFEDIEGWCLDCRSKGLGAGKEDVGKSMRPRRANEEGGGGWGYNYSPFSIRGEAGVGSSSAPHPGKGKGKGKATATGALGVIDEDNDDDDFEISDLDGDERKGGDVPDWKAH